VSRARCEAQSRCRAESFARGLDHGSGSRGAVPTRGASPRVAQSSQHWDDLRVRNVRIRTRPRAAAGRRRDALGFFGTGFSPFQPRPFSLEIRVVLNWLEELKQRARAEA